MNGDKNYLRKYLSAMRRNNYTKIKTELFKVLPGNKIGACAAGQAILNLGIVTDEEVLASKSDRALRRDLNGRAIDWISAHLPYNTFSTTYNLNDGTDLSVSEIADELERRYLF